MSKFHLNENAYKPQQAAAEEQQCNQSRKSSDILHLPQNIKPPPPHSSLDAQIRLHPNAPSGFLLLFSVCFDERLEAHPLKHPNI